MKITKKIDDAFYRSSLRIKTKFENQGITYRQLCGLYFKLSLLYILTLILFVGVILIIVL